MYLKGASFFRFSNSAFILGQDKILLTSGRSSGDGVIMLRIRVSKSVDIPNVREVVNISKYTNYHNLR